MKDTNITNIKLTSLQEEILLEYSKNTDYSYICKKLDIKPITLSKVLQSLKIKGLIDNNTITLQAKELINYLNFKNETIINFLKCSNILSDDLLKQMQNLDLKIIIALKNLLNH
jgi:predicted transcriptional regulator